MENKEIKELTREEEKELREGSALYEMTQTSAGWQVIKELLETVSNHSWVDPRGMKKEDWEFAELNAFHAANNAKELLETIQVKISRAEHLGKVKSGEVQKRTMRF